MNLPLFHCCPYRKSDPSRILPDSVIRAIILIDDRDCESALVACRIAVQVAWTA